MELKHYIGTKEITARRQTLGKYNTSRGWTLPEDEDGAREGYRVVYPDGYISWSPKEAFELAYRTSGEFDFGQALLLLKDGATLSRKGWNGRGMFIFLNSGSLAGNTVKPDFVGGVRVDLFAVGDNDTATRMPNINISNVDGSTSTWVPSIGDCLAEDWGFAEPAKEETFFDRLTKEAHELTEKVMKLGEFITSQHFFALSDDAQADLKAQSDAMVHYLSIVNRRIRIIAAEKVEE